VFSISEASTRVVAQNNALAAMAHHDNPYLTKRLFDSVSIISESEKLFEHQASILRRNRYAVDLQAHKYDGVAKSSANILLNAPSPTISPFINNISTVNAASHTRCQSSQSSLKQMLSLLEQRPTDVGLLLTIIQLHVLANNSGSAITILEAFLKRVGESTSPSALDIRFAPGLIALLVSLYRLEGRKRSIEAALKKAASYWREKSSPPKELLVAAGVSLLNSFETEELATAGEIFSSLRKLSPDNRIAITGFMATNNLPKVQPDLNGLSRVDRLISGINASALEDGGVPSIPVTITSVRKRSAPIGKEESRGNKRIRKSKAPKEFEEGKKMDPERWLPMRDRSGYRPKGKKGKKRALDITQGGIVKEEESLELVGGAGAVKVEKASVGGGNNKAKKKKSK
jgi:signal recognition particle subunit SRP72